MPPDLAKLQTLKDKLRTATDFASVWTYFLDEFGESREFHSLGELVRDPFLESIFDRMARQVFGGPVDLTRIRLTRIADSGFIHGGGVFDGRILNILYFEDIEMGMFMAIKMLGVGPTIYGRVRRGDFAEWYRPSAN